MSSATNRSAGSGREFRITGRVLSTIGAVCLTISTASAANALGNFPPIERTILGLLIASVMVALGEMYSRRAKDKWYATVAMATGYSLAYFFVYSLYYVHNLRTLDTPYPCWILAVGLGAIGTYHGTINKTLKWFTSVYTLVITGHALYQAFHSVGTITIGGFAMHSAALGCLGGLLWSAALSAIHKRLELPYKGKATASEHANWLLHRVLHETYFIVAAFTAMAMPLLQSGLKDASLCWPIEATILLAISFRSGNYLKHAAVAAMWVSGTIVLLANAFNAHPDGWAADWSVLLTGAAMSMTYRFLATNNKNKWIRLVGCQAYLYASIAVALGLPYLLHGFLASTHVWMIEGVVISGIGVALRHKFVHLVGTATAIGSLVLFYIQAPQNWHTWTWGSLGPIIAGAYALSVAYSYVVKKGGWANSDFFSTQYDGEAIPKFVAQWLEKVWSAVGCSTLLVASVALVSHDTTVVWWSVESLLLIAAGFFVRKIDYRLQGLLALALSLGKLFWWDHMSATMLMAGQFAAVGASAIISSILYFREEKRLLAPPPPAPAAPVPAPPAPVVKEA